MDGVDVKKITDKTFTGEKKAKKDKGRDFFNSENKEKKKVSKERMDAQKSVDAALVKAQGKAPKGEEGLLKSYLRARFSLGKNDRVHAMKFWASLDKFFVTKAKIPVWMSSASISHLNLKLSSFSPLSLFSIYYIL